MLGPFRSSGCRLEGRLRSIAHLLAPETRAYRFDAMDRATWHETTGFSFYWAYRQFAENPSVTILPPFRNALTDGERSATMIRLAARAADQVMASAAVPGTARYRFQTQAEKENNAFGLAALVCFGGGLPEAIHPTLLGRPHLPGLRRGSLADRATKVCLSGRRRVALTEGCHRSSDECPRRARRARHRGSGRGCLACSHLCSRT